MDRLADTIESKRSDFSLIAIGVNRQIETLERQLQQARAEATWARYRERRMRRRHKITLWIIYIAWLISICTVIASDAGARP